MGETHTDDYALLVCFWSQHDTYHNKSVRALHRNPGKDEVPCTACRISLIQHGLLPKHQNPTPPFGNFFK